MRRLLLASTFLAAAAAPAAAADTAIIMWNGANPGGAEVASGTGSASIGPTNLGGIVVTLTTANKDLAPNGLSGDNILVTNIDSTAQTLDVIFGANGYPGPSSKFSLSGTIIANVVSGGVSQADLAGSYFVDASNTLNGLSTAVVGTNISNFDSGLLTGPDSFSFNGFGTDNVLGTYGMAERLTLTLQPGASIGVQGISMEAVKGVPEPSTWAMMFGGFALLGYAAYRRNRGFAHA